MENPKYKYAFLHFWEVHKWIWKTHVQGIILKGADHPLVAWDLGEMIKSWQTENVTSSKSDNDLFSQKIIILGFNDIFRWAQLTWDCSGPRICQGMGRPAAERWSPTDSATDSATDSPKRIFVPPIYSFKIDHLSILVRRMNKNDAKWRIFSVLLL